MSDFILRHCWKVIILGIIYATAFEHGAGSVPPQIVREVVVEQQKASVEDTVAYLASVMPKSILNETKQVVFNTPAPKVRKSKKVSE